MIDWASITGFQWDDANATKSSVKHGIDCREAESVFVSPNILVLLDPKHSTPDEVRWHAFGTSASARPLSVTFTVRGLLIRIISARPMNPRERKSYGYPKN
jgi:uncharacterized DUF497 family protein